MKNFKYYTLDIFETFALSFIIIMFLYKVVASIEVVWGSSMEPNFYSNERILVDRITPIFDDYKRGDVIVFIPPNDEDKHYIKRIIGLPGELLKINDCRVYINNEGDKYEIEESYLFENICTSGGTEIKEGRSIKIPMDQYLALGDNRTNSVDSRYIGFIDRDKIIGRVVFILWPIGRIGFVN